MKIKHLQIKNYKNLDADLAHESDLIAIIGNNGSGKSNMLEAISQIFRSLYRNSYKIDFDYSIEYITSKNNKVRIDKKGSARNFHVDDKPMVDISVYLPQKVVAIYSGEADRLYGDCYGPFYLEFVRNINKASAQGTDYSNLPRMLYLNKFYWHLSLLSLLVSDAPDNKRFIKEVLKIDSVEKIKFDFQKKNYAEYNDNLALQFVKEIDSKDEYEVDELKKVLADKGYVPDDLYKFLYLAYTPGDSKIVNDIIIRFNKHLSVVDLSEGEKKLLLIKAAFEFAAQEDSLFILDEPDAHVHLNNKEQIIKAFEPYKGNRQIVITTHSPTITQAISDENVYMLTAGKIEDRNRQEIISEITGEFWSKHQQNSFLASKKPIVLLVEGKLDKEHILLAFSKLKDEYPELKFDIFYMNSANNVPPMMLGLRTSEIEYDKLCIGIFDDDETGRKELSLTTCLFPAAQNKKRHELGFYSFAYPKHANHKSGDFTVECFYETKYILEAYSEAFKTIGHSVQGRSMSTINEKLEDLTKNNLLAKAKTFIDKEEFKNFRLLFDVLKTIKADYDVCKKGPIVPGTLKPITPPVAAHIVEPAIKVATAIPVDMPIPPVPANKKAASPDAKYLRDKGKLMKQLYNKVKQGILDLDASIDIVPQQEYVAFKRNKRNIVDIRIQTKDLKLWINTRKGTLTDPKNITEDVSQKGHLGNGDYQISISNDENLDYIFGLIKQTIG